MKRRAWMALLPLGVLPLACTGLPDRPVPLPEMPAFGDPVSLPDDPARQFDFWLGEWDVRNLQLQRSRWVDAGSAVARVHPVLDGGAVLEQWNGTVGDGPLAGFSLRAYDAELGKWVVYLNWHDGEPSGFSAMHGSRRGERIEQFPPESDRQVRYSFSAAHEDSCQWDEARSTDGETWITRWVMQFTRSGRTAPLDATNAPIVDPPASAAAFENTRALDFLIGAWRGSARKLSPDGVEEQGTVHARVTSMIEGFGLLQFLDTSWDEKTLTALGYDEGPQGWAAVRGGTATRALRRLQGGVSPGGATFFGDDLRESWACTGDARCTWKRETSADSGTSWVVVLEADLRRSASRSAWIDLPRGLTPFADVLSGGQPTDEQLALAAASGYRTVINLRPDAEEGAMTDEGARVRELGMRYVHIPVAGTSDLTSDNAALLASALAGPDALPAIVHCRSGNRVGALFALQARDDGATPEDALQRGLDSGLTKLEPFVRKQLGLPPRPE